MKQKDVKREIEILTKIEKLISENDYSIILRMIFPTQNDFCNCGVFI